MKAKARLAETTALLNSTQKLAQIGSWKLDLETGIPTWTIGVFLIHELKYDHPYAIKVDQAINFYTPEDRPRIEAAIEAAAKHQKEFDLTCRLRAANGVLKWVRVTGKPVIPPQGEVREIVGFIMDVTEQQKAIAAFNKRAEMQQLIMMMASNFINLPLSHIPAAINQALEKIGRFVQTDRTYVFSINRRKQIATNTYEWCAAGISPQIDHLQAVPLKRIPSILQHLDQGITFYQANIAEMPPGQERQILESQDIKSILIVPMTDQGTCTGFVGFDAVKVFKRFSKEEQQILQFFAQMLVNIHLRSTAEQRLQEKQETLEKLTASVPGTIIQLELSPDKKLSMPFISNGIYGMHPELTPEQIAQGFPYLFQLISQKDQSRLWDGLIQSANRLQPFSDEYRVRGADGDLRWNAINAKPEVREDGTVVWYGIFQDITRQKEIEDIKRRSRELEIKNKELEQFTYLASHDLQEPLRTINSFVEILRKRPSIAEDSEAQKYIEFVQEGAVRMRQLIEGLLEYSVLGTGKKQKETVSIPALLQTVLQDLSKIIRQKEAEVHIEDIPEEVTGYPLELRLLFQNLISNALKFHKVGLPPTIRITGKTLSDKWLFFIHDNGIGIPSQQQTKIFRIFKRLHHRSEYGGTGIGLSYCKKIVELHHGSLYVSSQEGKGSTFSFSIRRTHRVDEAAAKPHLAG